jgi:recombination protein RecA
MGAAVLHKQFESLLGGPLSWQSLPAPERVPTGIPDLEFPRGCLTEIVGPASSGRTTLLFSLLAQAAARQEICALIDAADTFSPHSAAAAGVDLAHLLWVRCRHNAEHALKAVDLLIQGGGFGLIVMDLGDTPLAAARRISLTSWFRLRRAVEHTPTVLVTLARESNARTCATLVVECARRADTWSGAPGVSRLLRASDLRAQSTQRRMQCSPVFTALAI